MELRKIEKTRMKVVWNAAPILLAAIFAALNGCGGGTVFAPMEREAFQDALADLDVRWRQMESMRTQMTVKVNDPSGSQEVRGLLHFKKPDSFRFSALEPFQLARRSHGRVGETADGDLYPLKYSCARPVERRPFEAAV